MNPSVLCRLLLALLLFAATISRLTAQQSSSESRVERKYVSGGTIRMHLNAGGYDIMGTDSNAIVVTYNGGSLEKTRKIKVNIQTGDSVAELWVKETPHSNFHAAIEVPRRSDLWIRLTAGDLKVGDIEGNKDVEVYAGEVEIRIAHPEDYGHRDISVTTGSIDAPAFDISKGGLWRSFRENRAGKYALHVHVAAGEVTLSGTL